MWLYMFPSTVNSPVFLLTVPKSPACFRRGVVKRVLSNKEVDRDANKDVSRRVPIGPLCGGLLDQIDVLALRILLCAEESHCGSSGCAGSSACGQMAYMWESYLRSTALYRTIDQSISSASDGSKLPDLKHCRATAGEYPKIT